MISTYAPIGKVHEYEHNYTTKTSRKIFIWQSREIIRNQSVEEHRTRKANSDIYAASVS